MLTKETERLIDQNVVLRFKEEFDLKEGFIIRDGIKVPVLFNSYIVLDIYIELGSLELSVSNIKNWRWNRMPVDSYYPPLITHKEYFKKVTQNMDEIDFIPVEMTGYLYYYLNFITDFLPEIFNGDFEKIDKYMEPMSESQIKEIKDFLILS